MNDIDYRILDEIRFGFLPWHTLNVYSSTDI